MSSQPVTKRLFIGIPFVPEPSFSDKCLRLRRCTTKTDKAVWVEPSLYHMTLKFLGETDERRIPEICQALAMVTAHYNAFQFQLDKIGAFGSRYCPRALWIGAKNTPGELLHMHKELDRALARAGFPPDFGNFVCHMTLARIKRILNKAYFWKQVDACGELFSEQVDVREVLLYDSVRLKNGPPQYLVCARFPLG